MSGDYACVTNAIALVKFVYANKRIPQRLGKVIDEMKTIVKYAGRRFADHPFFLEHHVDDIIKELDNPKFLQWLTEQKSVAFYVVLGTNEFGDPGFMGLAAGANRSEVEEFAKNHPARPASFTIFEMENSRESVMKAVNEMQWWCCERGLVKAEAEMFISRILATMVKEGIIKPNSTWKNNPEFERFVREYAFKGME